MQQNRRSLPIGTSETSKRNTSSRAFNLLAIRCRISSLLAATGWGRAGAGWAAYAIKGTARTKSLLGSRALTATAQLRKLAQGEYEADQEAYRLAIQPEKLLPHLSRNT